MSKSVLGEMQGAVKTVNICRAGEGCQYIYCPCKYINGDDNVLPSWHTQPTFNGISGNKNIHAASWDNPGLSSLKQLL